MTPIPSLLGSASMLDVTIAPTELAPPEAGDAGGFVAVLEQSVNLVSEAETEAAEEDEPAADAYAAVVAASTLASADVPPAPPSAPVRATVYAPEAAVDAGPSRRQPVATAPTAHEHAFRDAAPAAIAMREATAAPSRADVSAPAPVAAPAAIAAPANAAAPAQPVANAAAATIEPPRATNDSPRADRAKRVGPASPAMRSARALSPANAGSRPAKATMPSASVAAAPAPAPVDERADVRSIDDASSPPADALLARTTEPAAPAAAPTHHAADASFAAGALTPNDDRLTTVNGSTHAAREQRGTAEVHAGRERAIETATRAADRHAIARGVHAEIELGDAGRVHVHASRPDERIHVRLDADAAATARMLGEHAGELARELRTNVHDARVTVSGPTTHATATSEGSARGDRGNGSSHGREERPAIAQNDDGAHARRTPAAARAARARFVL